MFGILVTSAYQDRLPTEFTWAVVTVVFLSTKPTMNALFTSQCGVSKTILSSWLHNLVNLYISMKSETNDEADDFLMSLGDRLDVQDIDKLVELKQRIKSSILASLKDILEPFSVTDESMCHYWLCLMLDPRFKFLEELQDLQEVDGDFKVTERVEFYEACLYRAMKMCYMQMHATTLDQNEEIGRAIRTRDFPHHRRRRRQQDRVKNLCKEQYLSFRGMDSIDQGICPLHWYETFKGTFPILAPAARHIFCIPASQSSVERLFSVCGHILSARRNRLKIDSLHTLVNICTNISENGGCVSFDDFIE